MGAVAARLEELESLLITREASCACGQLKIRCVGDPKVVAICHCLDCQRRTGSAFSVHAWFASNQVTLPGSGFSRFSRKANSGREVRFCFCSNCGGTVFWEADLRPDYVAVAVGAFADPTFAAPTEVYFKERSHQLGGPWSDTVSGGPLERS